jgi:hypothetical protein
MSDHHFGMHPPHAVGGDFLEVFDREASTTLPIYLRLLHPGISEAIALDCKEGTVSCLIHRHCPHLTPDVDPYEIDRLHLASRRLHGTRTCR